jgi:hypothetical protein
LNKAALVLCFASLTGCKTLVSSDLFTSDIVAATKGAEISVPVVLGFEMSTMNRAGFAGG